MASRGDFGRERGGSKENERGVLKLKSMNGNRLGNYSVVAALCGKEQGGNVKMADNKMASKDPKSAPRTEEANSSAVNKDTAPQLDMSEAS